MTDGREMIQRARTPTVPAQARTSMHSVRPTDRPRAHDGTTEAEQQILRATERLLETIPLTELSVAQILKEANVARTTFYFYFSSKYGPVSALLASIMDQIFERVTLFTERTDPGAGEETLDKGLQGATELFRDHRMLLRATVEHWRIVPELRKQWLDIMERFALAFAHQIDRQREAGSAPPGPPSRPLATALIWGSERMLYIAGTGLLPDLPSEDEALESIQAIWKSVVYGTSTDA